MEDGMGQRQAAARREPAEAVPQDGAVAGEGAALHLVAGTPAGADAEDAVAATKAVFLEALSECCAVKQSAETAGVPLSTLHRWRRTDDMFARRWAEALEDGRAMVEMKLIEVALTGEVIDNERWVEDGRRRLRTRRVTVAALRKLLEGAHTGIAARGEAVVATVPYDAAAYRAEEERQLAVVSRIDARLAEIESRRQGGGADAARE
jgi:hypothetical protein